MYETLRLSLPELGDAGPVNGLNDRPFYITVAQVYDRMATTDDSIADLTEECPCCDRQTPHDVSVQILTESTKEQNSEYSREPYRVSECRECGETTTTRMNNA